MSDRMPCWLTIGDSCKLEWAGVVIIAPNILSSSTLRVVDLWA